MNYEEPICDFSRPEEMRLRHEAEVIATYDIGAERYKELMETGVLPKYVNIDGTPHRRSVDTGDELTHEEFLALPPASVSRRNVGQDARNWLFALIHGRLRAYEERGRCPLLSIEEIIDAVGVDRPDPAQVDYARGIVVALFGQPKMFDGKDRWRVKLSFDHQTLGAWLHERFPLPRFDWERTPIPFERPAVELAKTAAQEAEEVN